MSKATRNVLYRDGIVNRCIPGSFEVSLSKWRDANESLYIVTTEFVTDCEHEQFFKIDDSPQVYTVLAKRQLLKASETDGHAIRAAVLLYLKMLEAEIEDASISAEIL